jgi:carboxyl-terminal processing protease
MISFRLTLLRRCDGPTTRLSDERPAMRLLTAWLGVAMIVGCTWAGPFGRAEEPMQAAATDYELLKLFADTLDQVERNYVKEVDRRELMEAAIKGMLTKLDPYSNYIAPGELERFRTGIENEFGGVGLQVSAESGELKVVTPIFDTPAYRAGIAAGDVIESIDGHNAKGMSIDEAVRRMKGKLGTAVDVAIRRADGTTEVVKLTRETVKVETVLGDHRNADHSWNYWLDEPRKIAYVRLGGFGRQTAADLQKALEVIAPHKPQALILDLRNNPGGLLAAAIEICDLFVETGRIVSTSGRNMNEQVWDAKQEGTHSGFPMAVLVNRYSASASEIVSACLQDHERAIVVGERTWGKGSVQNIIELESGKSALKLTTAGYKRPNGKNIHKFPGAKDDEDWGVRPNDGYEVKLSDDALRANWQARLQREVIRKSAGGETPELPPLADPQLEKAVEYLREKLGDPVPAPPQPPAAG